MDLKILEHTQDRKGSNGGIKVPRETRNLRGENWGRGANNVKSRSREDCGSWFLLTPLPLHFLPLPCQQSRDSFFILLERIQTTAYNTSVAEKSYSQAPHTHMANPLSTFVCPKTGLHRLYHLHLLGLWLQVWVPCRKCQQDSQGKKREVKVFPSPSSV